jgi:iron complex outermembrane receptor protein
MRITVASPSRPLAGSSRSMPRHPRVALILAVAAAWPMQQAVAQQAPADGGTAQLDQVNVTAQRKTENYKDVPVSATVLNSETLETIATSGQDIRVLAAKVPSLNIESSNGRTFPRVYIRGYGNTDFNTYASQPVSLVYDDVVQENAILKGFPIFDLENVEVLRGPQGSLFGRNTPAGVIKFNSVKPVLGATDGYASISFGSLATTNFEAASSVPLGQEWAIRASVLGEHRRDWVTVESKDPTNLYNGQKTEGYDDGAARIQLLYQPSAQFNALFNVHARALSGTARVFRANIIKRGTDDLVDGFNPDFISSNGKNQQNLRTNGANANLTWKLGDISLHSITGYESIGNYFTRGDIDGGDSTNTPFPVETAGGVTDHKQLTQEFRIASETPGPFAWQTGLYYFFEDLTAASYGYRSSTGVQTSYATTSQINAAYAAFGSATLDLTQQLNLRAGVRYTDDKKTFTKRIGFSDPGATKLSGAKTTGDIAGTFKIDPDLSVYARVATGFRGASFNSPSSGQALTSAVPETVTSYETGIKADLLNKSARVSFDVYHFDVKNQQLTAVGGNSNITSLINAKKTTGDGAEFNVEALLTKQFKVSVGGSYNKTEIKDPSLSVAGCGSGCTVTDTPVPGRPGFFYINGNPLPQAPKFITYATAKYTIPVGNGDLSLSTDLSYRTKINLFLYESVEFTGKSLFEAGLRLGYRWGDGRYEAAAFCRNCTNQIRVNGAIDFNNLEGFINDPRVVGVQFRVNWL